MNYENLVENLTNHGFVVKQFQTKEEVANFFSDTIHQKTIGVGGSLSVKECNIDQVLEKDNTVYWHWNQELIKEYGVHKVQEMASKAQIYLSSANAIAQTGEIVNIDGIGNRISATAFGHEQVYFIIGKNKICANLEEAMFRAKNVAAPKNAQRLKKNTPCAEKADRCYDCNCNDRICNGTLIIERPMGNIEMIVILVEEDLGA